MYFCQTFVIGAACDKDELIRFWGQKVKDEGHIAVEASSTRRCRRIQLSAFILLTFACTLQSTSSSQVRLPQDLS